MTNQKLLFSLRLWGEELKPQTVTNVIGLQPKESYEKGFVKKLSSGSVTAPRELGIWVYEQSVQNSVEDALDSLLAKIDGIDLRKIEGVQIVILDLYLGFSDLESVVSESFECRLDNKTLSKLAASDLDFRITVS